HQILVSAGVAGGAELHHHLSKRHHFLAIEVPAALGKGLVFDVQRCHTGFFVFLDRAIDVEGTPIACIGVSHEGHTDGRGNCTVVGQHFCETGKTQFRFADTRPCCPRPRHVDHGKTLALNKLGGEAVVRPWGDDDTGLAQELPQGSSRLHRLSPKAYGCDCSDVTRAWPQRNKGWRLVQPPSVITAAVATRLVFRGQTQYALPRRY